MFSFVLSLVSLDHRVPHTEALHLALWTRVPHVKWLCQHLSLGMGGGAGVQKHFTISTEIWSKSSRSLELHLHPR